MLHLNCVTSNMNGFESKFMEGSRMETPAIVTIIKMMETLPEPVQNQVIEHLRDYLQELNNESE